MSVSLSPSSKSQPERESLTTMAREERALLPMLSPPAAAEITASLVQKVTKR